jgi:hypothetical protein
MTVLFDNIFTRKYTGNFLQEKEAELPQDRPPIRLQ